MTQTHGSAHSLVFFKPQSHQTKQSLSLLPLPTPRSLLLLLNSAPSWAAMGFHPVTW